MSGNNFRFTQYAGLAYSGVDNPDEAMTKVAFDLGDCNGQRFYRQVSRLAPGKPLESDVHNICHG